MRPFVDPFFLFQQFSELRALWNNALERGILCPARLNSLAPLRQNHCVLLSNALVRIDIFMTRRQSGRLYRWSEVASKCYESTAS
ncbi:hypothetical protein D3875_11520 [Deinococcus cavernae]|uniref:Uncharacterized protein n=1 Tax=Deinococcus cavernae TaxID=2320857 RepID=A0A418V7N3_9DEIO|nr:hypothetical protein D3875_11520 [Deinococcus cavernae]